MTGKLVRCVGRGSEFEWLSRSTGDGGDEKSRFVGTSGRGVGGLRVGFDKLSRLDTGNVLGASGDAHRSCDGDGIASAGLGGSRDGAFDSVARGKESVEALNEGGMTPEEGRDAIDHAGSVDALRFKVLHDPASEIRSIYRHERGEQERIT